MARHIATRRQWRRALLIGVPAVVVLVLLTMWGVDAHGSSGRVARNVSLAGKGVGGDSRAELDAEVNKQADATKARAVHIVTPMASYDTTADAMGLALDQPTTTDAVLRVGHTENMVTRPLRWIAALFSTRTVTPSFTVNRAVAAQTARTLEGTAHVDPVEPSLTASPAGTVTIVAGKPGVGIDVDRLADALVQGAPEGSADRPLEVHVDQGALPPRFTDAQAQQIADQANALAHRPLTLTIGAQTKPLEPALLASWFRAVPSADGASLGLVIDEAAMIPALAADFADAGQPVVEASFTVESGKPVLHPSQDGTGCCAVGAAAQVLAALQSNAPTLTLSVATRHPTLTTEAAQQLGIVEEVGQPGEFGPTTHHACCQPRVTNIHLIADIVRGHVILPGETFSVNGFVGQRTSARGFVDAPVIYDATESHDVGGGVSQFATTIFNASFFAGLDLVSYQSHSIYISRYPRGREATISWPAPDLKVKNSTPYGILLWPTYDDTTLTVHMYSTHFVDVTSGPPTDAKSGVCTRVTTPRTRAYVDGHVATDSVSALYQPSDGVAC